MNVLVFDTSSKDIYVALITDFYARTNRFIDMPSTEYLLDRVDSLLKDNNLSIGNIDTISVGVGPGSFTGSRVAVATAKGFLCAKPELKAVCFSSFDALSKEAEPDDMIVVEGFSDYVYVRNGDKERCVTKDEARKMARSCDRVLGLSNLLDVSNYAEAEYDIVNATRRKIKENKFILVDELEPLYLRASQAEIEFIKRRKDEGKED